MRLLTALLATLACALPLGAASHFVIIEGLGGDPEYTERFREEADKVAAAARKTGGEEAEVILLRGEEATREKLVEVFTKLQAIDEEDELTVILIGHGTWDGDDYKFNIPGPDITATRLAGLLDRSPAKRQLVVNTTSASGGAVDALRTGDRIVIAATKNGREKNATVFSRYWAEAFESPEADRDKNEIITVAEAFRYTESKVANYFEQMKKLATEHPRLEGELAESFTLARLGTIAEAIRDPALRPLLARREELEIQIDELKARKDAMDELAYLDELQTLLIELAQVQEEITAKTEAPEAQTVEPERATEPKGEDPR